MNARFRVQAEGPIFDGKREATVEIDRERNLFTVTPLRHRQSFTLPLATVASMAIWRCLKQDNPVVTPPRKRV